MDSHAATLGATVRALFALVEDNRKESLRQDLITASVAGYRFEDDAAKAAYEALLKVGVTPFPPRHTLQLYTVSSLHQQFDVVVLDRHRYFIVELKRRSHSEIEHLFAFVAKLLDYAIAAQIHETGHTFTGLFVSTATQLNDNFRRFALSFGVIPVATDLPPCQVLQHYSLDPPIANDLEHLSNRLAVPLPRIALDPSGSASPSSLLKEWQFLFQRCALSGNTE